MFQGDTSTGDIGPAGVLSGHLPDSVGLMIPVVVAQDEVAAQFRFDTAQRPG